MEVYFKTKRLQRRYQDSALAVQQWGTSVARRYVTRVSQLYALKDLSEARNIKSLRLHPLNGTKTGQLSIHLTGDWRLILKEGDTDEWVTIMGVSRNHGD